MMTGRFVVSAATVDQLVERFATIALAQYEAKYYVQTARYNRLYEKLSEVRLELKSRPGDARSALLPLLGHSNSQVRLQAAIELLAIEPDLAWEVLTQIKIAGIMPQAMDAASMLSAVEEGRYVPR